jgi:hypothetical protein
MRRVIQLLLESWISIAAGRPCVVKGSTHPCFRQAGVEQHPLPGSPRDRFTQWRHRGTVSRCCTRVWSAIATGWRASLRGEGLAEEQAALRRVATLVARGVPPEEVSRR